MELLRTRLRDDIELGAGVAAELGLETVQHDDHLGDGVHTHGTVVEAGIRIAGDHTVNTHSGRAAELPSNDGSGCTNLAAERRGPGSGSRAGQQVDQSHRVATTRDQAVQLLRLEHTASLSARGLHDGGFRRHANRLGELSDPENQRASVKRFTGAQMNTTLLDALESGECNLQSMTS